MILVQTLWVFYVFYRKPKCKTQVPLSLIFCSTPRTHKAQRGSLGFFRLSLSLFLSISPPRKKASMENTAAATPAQLSQKEKDIQMMLASHVHLGTKNIDFQMERYVFKRRSDGRFFSLSFLLFLFWVIDIVSD